MGTFMGELHESLEDVYEVRFLVPTPKSILFTGRWHTNRSKLIHKNAKRVYYWSVPKRKLPVLTKRSLLKTILNNISAAQYEIIHIHWAYPEILLFPEIKKNNKRVCLTFHGYLFYDVFMNPLLRPFLNEALQSTDRVFAVGKQLEKDIKTYFPQHAHKVFHIPNGINEHKFTIGDKSESRNQLGFSQDKKHVLCVANLAQEKGVDVLVNAVAASSLLKDTHFHIIGRTIDHAVLKEMETTIHTQGIKNITIHGPVPHNTLPLYYHSADAFVLPSRTEGFGVALVEAGMCGLPMVSTKSGGPEEIVDIHTGLLANAGDVNDLKEKLETLMHNLQSYNPGRIRSTMIEKYSRAAITKLIQNHYENLLK